jgi:hypothetical protein
VFPAIAKAEGPLSDLRDNLGGAGYVRSWG